MEGGDQKNLYIGFDESNHGRFPEIFVAAFSKLEKDILNKHPLSKKRHHRNLFIRFRRREYSFLTVEENDYERIPRTDFHGIVLSSLLLRDVPEDIGKIKLLLDGPFSTKEKLRIKDIISDRTEIEKRKLGLDGGADFDRTYQIVNLADEMAHYLFRQGSPEKLSKDPHRRYLIL